MVIKIFDFYNINYNNMWISIIPGSNLEFLTRNPDCLARIRNRLSDILVLSLIQGISSKIPICICSLFNWDDSNQDYLHSAELIISRVKSEKLELEHKHHIDTLSLFLSGEFWISEDQSGLLALSIIDEKLYLSYEDVLEKISQVIWLNLNENDDLLIECINSYVTYVDEFRGRLKELKNVDLEKMQSVSDLLLSHFRAGDIIRDDSVKDIMEVIISSNWVSDNEWAELCALLEKIVISYKEIGKRTRLDNIVRELCKRLSQLPWWSCYLEDSH